MIKWTWEIGENSFGEHFPELVLYAEDVRLGSVQLGDDERGQTWVAVIDRDELSEALDNGRLDYCKALLQRACDAEV